MTNLTEKLKKGELPDNHHYYYKLPNGKCEIGNTFCIETLHWCKDGDKIEVIAEVPDYVEWQNMVNCACEEHEANKRFIEENAQLKELLKEVLRHELSLKEVTELTKKISEVLGEE